MFATALKVSIPNKKDKYYLQNIFQKTAVIPSSVYPISLLIIQVWPSVHKHVGRTRIKM